MKGHCTYLLNFKRLIFSLCVLITFSVKAQQFEHPYSNRVINQPGQSNIVGKGPSKKEATRKNKRKSRNYKSYSGKTVAPNPSASTYQATKSSSRAGVDPNSKFKTGRRWINTKSFGEDPSGKFLFTPEERGLNVRGVNRNDRFKTGRTWINEKALGVDPKDKYYSSYGDNRGDLDYKAWKKSKDFKSKDLYWYSGDISMSDYKKQKDFRSKDLYDYSGDMSVRAIKKQERKIKAKAKQMDGIGNQEIIIVSKGKNMHPSIAAQGAKVRTYEQTKRYRNRQRLWNKWFKNRELPPAERKEPKKPTYDSREAAIWN